VIRASFILLAAHVVIPRLRGRSSAERHLLWALALLTAATMPVFTVVLPVWHLEWATRAADAWPAFVSMPVWAGSDGPEVILRPTSIEPTHWGIVQWGVLVWAAGAVAFLARLGRDVARLVALVRPAVALRDRRCLEICEEIARQLRLERVPRLLASPRVLVPITWGVRHPCVLMPADVAEWSRERVRVVLAHELAHVARADWIVHVVAQVGCAIYWFHPLFWLAERAVGRESEQAADDRALALGLDASHYAEQLIAIVRACRVPMSAHAPVVGMARAAHLERRVAALLRPHANRAQVARRTALATAGCAVAMALPLAAITAAGGIDVDIRAADLPVAVRASSDAGREPMLPALRRARTAPRRRSGQAVAGLVADERVSLPEIAEYTTPPLYSDEARRLRIEGIVTVAVHIDEHGRLVSSRIEKGLGSGLDQNALVALRQWRFRPGTWNDVPSAIDAEVDIEFDLRSEAVNELIANDMATLVGPDVTPPRIVRRSRVTPAARAFGSVVLDVVLLQDGSPKIVRILRSLNSDADESAVRHFEQWRFTPAMKNGVPIKVRMTAEVRFHG
jgi:TonB family protein